VSNNGNFNISVLHQVVLCFVSVWCTHKYKLTSIDDVWWWAKNCFIYFA